MEGTRHLIECQCILPIFKDRKDPPFHKFPVFSVIDADENVVSSLAKCENCGSIHKIIEICKSEIVLGKEDARGIQTIFDIKQALPANIINILETYKCDLSVWQHTKFILDNQKWGVSVVLENEAVSAETSGKILTFLGPQQLNIESFNREDMVGNKNE